MSQSTRALFLILAMVWQTLAVLGPWVISSRSAEVEHMALHGQDASHHHHDDQALHLDEQEAGPQHLHADSGLSASGLIPSAAISLGFEKSPAPVVHTDVARRPPFIEGLLRPPAPAA